MKPTLGSVAVSFAVAFVCSSSCWAAMIARDVQMLVDPSLVVTSESRLRPPRDQWRQTVAVEPVQLDVGDSVEITIRFDRPVVVTQGEVRIGNGEFLAGGLATSMPTLPHTSARTMGQLQLLGGTGDLPQSLFTSTTQSGGAQRVSIATGNNITDGRFSFSGLHYRFVIDSGENFPAVFDSADVFLAVDGEIAFAVPEPGGLALTSLIGLVTGAQRRRVRIPGYPA